MELDIPEGMLLGFHAPVSGGIDKAPQRLAELGCPTGQIFTKSNRQWKAREFKGNEVENYHRESEKLAGPIVAHSAYLINLANPKKDVRKKSIDALIVEVERAEKLKIPYLVLHPGLHVGAGEDDGLKLICEALDIVHSSTPNFKTKILLEITAGQGTALGYSLKQLAHIRANIENPERSAYCLDTCHMHAAGYRLSTEKDYEKTAQQVEDILGLNLVKVFHLNDAREECGSKVDRHKAIGAGKIGAEGFACLINDSRWKKTAKILETPVENNEWKKYYGKNLQTLLGYVK